MSEAESHVVLRLTFEQAENLARALEDVQDCGPLGEGWASDEVCELRAIVDAALNAEKRPTQP